MEYRSGETGGPHPEVDIFLNLFPMAKPYCGVILPLMESKTAVKS